jgi:phosphatidylserine decarboxylase
MSSLSFGERVTRSAWRATPQRALSDLIGWWARRGIPSSVRASYLRGFARHYGINVEEAEMPLESYRSVQELFTRKLRPDARPIDPASDAVVSPADGAVVERGVIVDGKLIDAKGTSFTLADLFGDADLAAALDGGAFDVTYLSPKDYHRVHSPLSGQVTGWRYVPGKLFPVNAGSVMREPGLFAKNERFVTVIDGEAGKCAVVMVAAVGVGHITAAYDSQVATHAKGFPQQEITRRSYDQPIPIARGGEVGTFHMGSTSIVVFERGRVTLDPLTSGTTTRMGRAMGRLVGRGKSAQVG